MVIVYICLAILLMITAIYGLLVIKNFHDIQFIEEGEKGLTWRGKIGIYG